MVNDVASTGDWPLFIWLGIVFCLSQSAMFSGLNIAMFSVSRLRLEVEAAGGTEGAKRVLEFRRRSNHVLTTILWGNVGINVLLALLSDSVMSGVVAFLFSTILITVAGEIVPQAYFSRNALRMAALLAPVLRFYMILLYPFAKPSALMLDAWLGQEGPQYLRERDLREVIRKHIEASEAEIDRLEGVGALNFLAIDDLAVRQAGSALAPASIVALPFEDDRPVFPAFTRSPDDNFLRRLHASGRRWVVLTDPQGDARLVLDADTFLREALLGTGELDPMAFLYRPTIIRDPRTLLGVAITRLEAKPLSGTEKQRGEDVILIWGEVPSLITGDDILRRLLSGIHERTDVSLSGATPTAAG